MFRVALNVSCCNVCFMLLCLFQVSNCLELVDDKSAPPASIARQKEILDQHDQPVLTPKQWSKIDIKQTKLKNAI